MNRSSALLVFVVAFTAFATSQLFGARPAAAPPSVFTDIGATAAPLTPVYYSSVALGDYNSDGKLDVLLTGYTGSARVSQIYKNNGDGTFTEDTTADSGLTGVSSSSVAWGDYNLDGKLDIVLTGNDAASNQVAKLYTQNSSGVFQ